MQRAVQNGRALEDAAKDLQADKEIVLAAVQQAATHVHARARTLSRTKGRAFAATRGRPCELAARSTVWVRCLTPPLYPVETQIVHDPAFAAVGFTARAACTGPLRTALAHHSDLHRRSA